LDDWRSSNSRIFPSNLIYKKTCIPVITSWTWGPVFLGFTTALCSESDGAQPQMYWCLCCTGVRK
jgi:hypothetical protein